MKAGEGSRVKRVGREKGVKTGGGSYMTNNMRVQGVCIGDYGYIAVGKRGGFSKIASYHPKRK